MKTDNSMNHYIERTVRRYSSLFTLPSHEQIILMLFVFSLISGMLVVYALELSSSSYYKLVLGLALGMALFVLTMLADFTVHLVSFRHDLIFNLRRCSALSLYSLIIWVTFIVLGILTNLLLHVFWVKLFLLGFSLVLALRLLVLLAVSFASIGKVFFYSILLPFVYTIPVLYIVIVIGNYALDSSVTLFFCSSLVVVLGAIVVFMYGINRVGVRLLGVGSFSVLRAFLASWTEDLNAPFEQFFERFGLKHDIKISALAFKAKDGVKAVLIVPTFHPGPFKNVGSSTLPSAIRSKLENRLPECIVAVPHGLSGHDLDLTSQAQNQLVLDAIQKMTRFSSFGSFAAPFVRVNRNAADVGCQIFDNCALVTLTLAPQSMEDLPQDLDSFIVSEAQRLKLAMAISIDAHNSIQGPFNVNEAVNPLKEAAIICLKKALDQKLKGLEVGVAEVSIKDFGLREGMGPGGIVVIIVKVGDQTTAYVTIDGNNMVSGLREKILLTLSGLGINEGEVFTTDTHVVNAVVLNARGYHPVGEAMDHAVLNNYIKQAAVEALKDLEPADVSWCIETVPAVRVIGEEQIEAMCTLTDRAIKRAKILAVSIFPLAGFVLSALLLLL